ncbi:RimK family alpha-L-glutamate ligase [Kitasatospora purpeofusca]|uniref:ATP-grasp domain-containing protein n=1 Tax=Kitasatospora purpeofusca TaxID=67352 RepID=UPI0036E43B0B
MTTPVSPPSTTPQSTGGPLRRMCWVFPDRESTRTTATWRYLFWDLYEEIAEELGLTWCRHSPDAVTVDATDPARPVVYVDEEPVTPQDTLFVTALYSLPYQSMDIFNQYSLYAVLEQAGFYLPFPPYVSLIGNDKVATVLHLADSPVPPIPSIRIGTGRDIAKHHYEVALDRLTYPAIVKPAGWCGGGGINLARGPEDIRGLASLAQGGDTTLVAQPYLGDGTVDYRVYVVDGEPYAVMRRVPEAGSPVANASRGGTMEFPPIPPELAEATAYFAEKLAIPFFCVDFLYDGEKYWFSELEPDGVIAPDFTDPDRALQRDITRARFTAYRDAHAKWLANGAPSAPTGLFTPTAHRTPTAAPASAPTTAAPTAAPRSETR